MNAKKSPAQEKRSLPKNVRERFEAFINKDESSGCWLWIGSLNQHGYGQFGINGRCEKAHRIAHRIYVGEIPNGLFVCHTCDVRHCVNPEHLYLGTASDNMVDMSKKGRTAQQVNPELIRRGVQTYNARYTEEQVRAVKILANAGFTNSEIQRVTGVVDRAVYQIKKGHTWKHIDAEAALREQAVVSESVQEAWYKTKLTAEMSHYDVFEAGFKAGRGE